MQTWFGKGLALHQKGHLPQALALYRQVLELQPAHADALHLSGVIGYQLGDLQQAVERMRRSHPSTARSGLNPATRTHTGICRCASYWWAIYVYKVPCGNYFPFRANIGYFEFHGSSSTSDRD